MNVFIDTNDKELVTRVDKALSSNYNVSLQSGIQSVGLDPKRSSKKDVTLYYGTSMFEHLDQPSSRMAQMAFATDGGVLFSDTDEKSPIFAGALPYSAENRVETHLKYAKNRKELFSDYEYFGQTYVDPKNVLVSVGNADKEVVWGIVKHSPDNWWYNSGFLTISHGDAKEFFEEFEFSQAIALSKDAIDMLEGSEVQYLDASGIDFSTPRSGILLRELSRRPDLGGVSIG